MVIQPQNSHTILITGGAGFIGANLAGRLLQENLDNDPAEPNKVVVFDSFSQGQHSNLERFASDPNLEVIQGDVRDLDQIDQVTNGVDQIYHLSSIVGVERYCEDPLEVIDVNIIGTRNIVDCAQRKDIRMLFTSTSEVFGKNPNVPWKEDDDRVFGSTSVDRWCYGASKAVCEHMIFALNQKGLRCTIVRLFNVYGPRQNPIFVVSRGIHRVLRDEPPLMYDSGEQTRCFTYVDDALEGMILAANHSELMGQSFNIGSSVQTSIREVNQMILEEARKEDRLQPEHVDTRLLYGNKYDDIQNRAPDVRKANQVLNWTPKFSLRQGIRMFIDWATENRWWLNTASEPDLNRKTG